MKLPQSRGRASDALFDVLERHPHRVADLHKEFEGVVRLSRDILNDDDLQCALSILYELHYRGIDGVDDAWEWNPELLRARAVIETAFETALRAVVDAPADPEPNREAVASALFSLTSDDSGASLSQYLATTASMDQLSEFLVQRSIYQLKEADPHAWAIPRLQGAAKAALVEIESDEYGCGDPRRMHSTIFTHAMRGLELDSTYGHYFDVVPAITLASANMMSLFGLHRRLRGAIVGHLAAFEMTSTAPNRRYGKAFRRHGFGPDVTWYFDEHVEADAVHEQIAARDLAGGLVESEPDLLADVMFGAAVCLTIDGMVGAHILEAWSVGESSLRVPLDVAA